MGLLEEMGAYETVEKWDSMDELSLDKVCFLVTYKKEASASFSWIGCHLH